MNALVNTMLAGAFVVPHPIYARERREHRGIAADVRCIEIGLCDLALGSFKPWSASNRTPPRRSKQQT